MDLAHGASARIARGAALSAALVAGLWLWVGPPPSAVATEPDLAPPGPTGAQLREIATDPATDGAPFALVELYTSEGCSSCPPADAALIDLARRAVRLGQRVFPVSLHIDYWDGLGWVDPFGQPAFTARQRAWAGLRGWGVYTPQAVVNGDDAFVGSDRSRLARAVGAALERPAGTALSLRARWDPSTDEVALRFTAPQAPAGARVIAVATAWEGRSEVRRGENRGRTLDHARVAQALAEVPVSDGALTLRLPADRSGTSLGITAWVQDARGNGILGANALELGPPAAQGAPPAPDGG